MSKLIRRTVAMKKGAALLVALQIITLTFLSLVSFTSGPQQPADLQMSAAQAETVKPQTASVQRDRGQLRASAVPATKLYEPLATQVFDLATARAAEVQNSQNTQN